MRRIHHWHIFIHQSCSTRSNLWICSDTCTAYVLIYHQCVFSVYFSACVTGWTVSTLLDQSFPPSSPLPTWGREGWSTNLDHTSSPVPHALLVTPVAHSPNLHHYLRPWCPHTHSLIVLYITHDFPTLLFCLFQTCLIPGQPAFEILLSSCPLSSLSAYGHLLLPSSW